MPPARTALIMSASSFEPVKALSAAELLSMMAEHAPPETALQQTGVSTFCCCPALPTLSPP